MSVKEPLSINIKGELISLAKPLVMGIINVTPDSFYSGSRYTTSDKISKRAHDIVSEGGDIIDIGAYSTRPNAEEISEFEEISRLETGLAAIRKECPKAIISVDTFRAQVAKFAAKNFDVDIINDISGGEADAKMFETVADLKLPYILMHMRGTPKTMQNITGYNNITADIIKYFSQKIAQLKKLGVNDIILDPGFGFAKTLDENYKIMASLEDFSPFEMPLLVGISRKSMIYKLLNTSPDTSINGTTVLNTIALTKGANILRVHDIKECVETIKIFLKTNC